MKLRTLALTVFLSSCLSGPSTRVILDASVAQATRCCAGAVRRPRCSRATAEIVPLPTAPQIGSAVQVARSAADAGSAATRAVAYVADEDTKTLRTFDLDLGREVAATALAGRPGQLVVVGD